MDPLAPAAPPVPPDASPSVLDEQPSQGERERAMDDLRRGRVQILVASDAASRSLDVAGTAHVVNFDVPQTPEDYVHRLGRGGRADPVGDAYTLMSPEEQRDVASIERFLGRAIPRVTLPDFDYTMAPRELRQVSAHEEEAAGRRAAAGVAAAAVRIAAVARPAVRSATPKPAHAAPRTPPKPARKPAPAGKAKKQGAPSRVRPRAAAGRASGARKRPSSTAKRTGRAKGGGGKSRRPRGR